MKSGTHTSPEITYMNSNIRHHSSVGVSKLEGAITQNSGEKLNNLISHALLAVNQNSTFTLENIWPFPLNIQFLMD